MQLTYYGHAAFQIDTGRAKILFDPFISGNPHTADVVTADELSPDVIVLTHAHGDHWGDTMDIARRSGALVVANIEITNYVQANGHDHVHPMNTGGASNFEWGRLKQTYACHSSSFPDGTYGGNPNGYLLEVANRCVYAAGDTCPFAEMAWIGEDHAIDVALLPIGDCFTMGPEDSIRAARMLRPALVVPVHYNTFPAITADIGKWKALMDEAGFAARILSPGDVLTM